MAPRNRRSTERSPSSDSRYSRVEFTRDFPDDDTCLEWLKNHLYPEGIYCHGCERVTKHHRVQSRPSYSCQFCGHHVHPTAGTIFHKSSTSLHLWFQGIYLMSSTRCGISAKQLGREIGVNYKTALRMFHKVRELLVDNVIDFPLSGDVEMDETFLNPSRRLGDGPLHSGYSPKERVIMGAVERGGRIVARHVPRASADEADKHLAMFVLPAANIFTDESNVYSRVSKERTHYRVKHSARVYVDGDVHTQTIEGFWSLFKRGLNGVYHSVSTKYLQGYIDEYAFRYNHRFDGRPMFFAFLAQVAKVAPSAPAPALGVATPS
jgi:transposase-like protein